MTPPNFLLMTSMSAPGFHSSPPVGLYRLKHHLEKNGISCDVLDADMDNEDPYLAAVEQGRYVFVGFSVSHYNMFEDLDRLWRFRNAAKNSPSNVHFIAGGQEAALNPEQWLNCGIDLVVLGFAEQNLLSLSKRYAAHQCPSLAGIAGELHGVAFLDHNRQLVFNPAAAMTAAEFSKFSCTALMEMDLPYTTYWSKVRDQVESMQFNRNQFVAENVRLFTSSHCPRRCGFCSSQSFLPVSHGKPLPIMSLTADEVYRLVMHHVQKYKARGFLFSDDDFLIGSLAGIERARRFCQLIIDAKERGRLPSDIIFNCQSRIADFLVKKRKGQRVINLELLTLLSRAGFHSVGLGVETFCDRLMNQPSIHKVGVTVSDCRNVLDRLLEFGLCPQINILLGIPESTVEELLDTISVTLDYIEKGCQVAITAYIRCIPGAPIYNSNNYKSVYKTWIHPESNQPVRIADSFIPNSVQIAAAMELLDEVSQNELETVKKRSRWQHPQIPKSVLGLTKLGALAKLLGASDIYDRSKVLTVELMTNSQTTCNTYRQEEKRAACIG